MNILKLLILLVMSSCAGLSKVDCTNMDWKKKGFQDGSQGEDAALLEHYQKECQQYGIVISKNNYAEGYQLGLKSFCTYHSGYELGRQGSKSVPECHSIHGNFSRGYKQGLQEFEEEEERNLIKKREEARVEGVSNILRRYDSKECFTSFDCSKEGECRLNKCVHNDKACNFNSDCQIEGQCNSRSEFIHEISEVVHLRLCEY